MEQYVTEQRPLRSKSHEFVVSTSLRHLRRQLIVQRSCNRNVNTNKCSHWSIGHTFRLFTVGFRSVPLQVFYMHTERLQPDTCDLPATVFAK